MTLKQFGITPAMKLAFALNVIFPFTFLFAQNENFYDIKKVQEIKIYFDYENWDYRLDTAKAGKEEYILAKYCLINGVKFDSVGVKYKGNSSYRNTNVKNPLHIKLDWVLDNQDYQKYSSIKLGNNFSDPSAVREALSYSILSNYMDCSEANFSTVYINDKYIGFYTNVEAVNKKFCSDHFGNADHVFVKGNPDRPGTNSTSNLVFNSYDSTKYYTYYGMENGFGWAKLIALMDTLKNNASALPKILDIDRAIWMHAFNSVFSNYDSYTGAFSQNYYLYEDDHGRFLPIIWDLNMSIGGFPGGIGGGGGTTTDKIPFFNGESNAARPLIQKILQTPLYKRMYTAHVRTLCNEFVANKEFETIAKNLQTIVDSFVKTDPNSLTTYAAFQNSLTAAISSGGGPGGAVPGISTLMNARLAYFKTVAEFNAIPPSITNIQWNNPSPKVNDTVWVNVSIKSGSEVFIGFRKNKSLPFLKQKLYDDGFHQDGIANDGVFGNYIIADSKKTQYYVYAENSSAGIFSPERAEFEYHVLEATEPFTFIQKGEVVVNELMSSNQSYIVDVSDDKYEDWAELYNTTNQDIDLGGLYFSDDFAKKDKWEFPKGTIIPAKGRLVLWLDEDSSEPTDLHANFKLSASGEELILSRPDGIIIDSLSFGTIPTDNSLERCPDGIGAFAITSKPTYNKVNCIISSNKDPQTNAHITIYPNPILDYFKVQFDQFASGSIIIQDIHGNIRYQEVFNKMNQLHIQLDEMAPGMYLVNLNLDQNQKFVKKIIVLNP